MTLALKGLMMMTMIMMSLDPWSSHVESVQHTWHSWISNRSYPSPRLAANLAAQSTQGWVVGKLHANVRHGVSR